MWSALGLAIAAIATTAIYIKRQSDKLLDYCYVFAGAVVHKLTATAVSITVIFNIRNKSDFEVKISRQRYNVYVNGVEVAKIDKAEEQVLSGNSKSAFQFKIDFNPQDFLRDGIKNIAEHALLNKQVIFQLKGTLTLKSGPFAYHNYPFDERMTLQEMLAPSTTPKADC